MFIFFHFILLLLLLFISLLLLLCLGFASDCLYVPSLSKVDFWCFFYIFVYLSAILLQMLYLFSLMSCFIFEVVVFFSYVAILASSCSWMLHRETKGVVSISDEFEERGRNESRIENPRYHRSCFDSFSLLSGTT